MRIALRRLVVAGSDSLKTIEASLIRASFNVIKLSVTTVTTIDNSIFQDPGFQYKLFSSSLPSPVSPLSTVYLACEQAFSLSLSCLGRVERVNRNPCKVTFTWTVDYMMNFSTEMSHFLCHKNKIF